MENGTASPPLIAALAERYSPKAFSSRAVPCALLASLFEAVRWAPSCYNDQPWRLIVAERGAADDAHSRLLGCLNERNRLWASTAPVLMLSVAATRYRHSGAPNPFAQHDLGLAIGAMLAQATAHGLAVHQMGGFDRETARTAFALPAEAEPVAAIALGFRGDAGALPAGVEERRPEARDRLAREDIVFAGSFGNPWRGRAGAS